ncbi:MAG: hypothetical protein AVDCRST_MAG49-1651, partial [uncultured Thermomicrobiales bacterium]
GEPDRYAGRADSGRATGARPDDDEGAGRARRALEPGDDRAGAAPRRSGRDRRLPRGGRAVGPRPAAHRLDPGGGRPGELRGLPGARRHRPGGRGVPPHDGGRDLSGQGPRRGHRGARGAGRCPGRDGCALHHVAGPLVARGLAPDHAAGRVHPAAHPPDPARSRSSRRAGQ